MKTEKEIKQYLETIKQEYRNSKKMGRKHLQTVAAGCINALYWVLEYDIPFDFDSEDK